MIDRQWNNFYIDGVYELNPLYKQKRPVNFEAYRDSKA